MTGPSMTDADFDRRFDHHPPPTPAVADKHAEARLALKVAAAKLHSLCPFGREFSIVLTKLEEAMMWANAGIARHHAFEATEEIPPETK